MKKLFNGAEDKLNIITEHVLIKFSARMLMVIGLPVIVFLGAHTWNTLFDDLSQIKQGQYNINQEVTGLSYQMDNMQYQLERVEDNSLTYKDHTLIHRETE